MRRGGVPEQTGIQEPRNPLEGCRATLPTPTPHPPQPTLQNCSIREIILWPLLAFFKLTNTHQVSEVGYLGHGVAGGELEGDASKDQDKGELDAVLRQCPTDSKSHQGQRADHRLRTRTIRHDIN